MSLSYFEDVKLHELYRSREYPLSEKEIIDFARVWDPAPFHIDPESAGKTRFKGLFAAGIHLMAICTRLANEAEPKPAYIAGMGWDEMRFISPARPGDVLVMEIEPIFKRESKSDPGAGIVTYATTLSNQQSEIIFKFKGTGLVEKRNKG